MTKDDDLFESVEVKDEVVLDTPEKGSKEWNDYVMSLFEEGEVFDGMPNCHGLRRVAELVLGNIVCSKPTMVVPPTGDSEIGRATVVWEVVFQDGSVYGDVADSWHGNTDDLFSVYNTATAATRAEARALRKALGIKAVSAEEITRKDVSTLVKSFVKTEATEGEYNNKDVMTDSQANFIDIKASQLNVNVVKFFSEEFGLDLSKEKVSKQDASSAIKKLNEYQQSDGDIPKSVLSYDSNWRS